MTSTSSRSPDEQLVRFSKLITAVMLFGWALELWVPLLTQAEAKTLPELQPEAQQIEAVVFDRVTYYNAVEWQTDSTPHVSACGPNRVNQVAVSRDLFESELHCGDVISVFLDGEGYVGDFVVWDTTNARFEGTLDILTEGSYAWGKTSGHATIKRRAQ